MQAFAPFDLALTFDAVHDMPRPDAVVRNVRQALKPGGMYFVMDWKHCGNAAANISNFALAEVMYGISVGLCMNCACSTPDGWGLGTLGMNAEVA